MPFPTRYARSSHPSLAFRLYMPLAHELALRDTLDGLFFSDTVAGMVRAMEARDLNRHFPRRKGEAAGPYEKRIVRRIGAYFAGYSLHHVDGRFRKGPMRIRRKADRDYLVDETTAVIHFVVPVDVPERRAPAEVDRIRWIFLELFMASLLAGIEGEAEVWLHESGFGDRIHVWDRR